MRHGLPPVIEPRESVRCERRRRTYRLVKLTRYQPSPNVVVHHDLTLEAGFVVPPEAVQGSADEIIFLSHTGNIRPPVLKVKQRICHLIKSLVAGGAVAVLAP